MSKNLSVSHWRARARHLASLLDEGDLQRRIAAHIEERGPIREPLVLISQISRSGGTFLNQLFDGHPELWTHPPELNIGWPAKWDWPELTGASPAEAFKRLCEPRLKRYSRSGLYSKSNDQTLPMNYDLALHRKLFNRLCRAAGSRGDRDLIDTYFTTFFAAWLDYQNRYGPKRAVVGFASMMALSPSSMQAYRQVYPDGKLVSIVREPFGWYRSVSRRSQGKPELSAMPYPDDVRHYAGREAASDGYLKNIRHVRDNRERFGDRFILVDYAALTHRPEETMRRIAERIGIEYRECLTQPTFNGMSVRPNTSFKESDGTVPAGDTDADFIVRSGMLAAYEEVRKLAIVAGPQ